MKCCWQKRFYCMACMLIVSMPLDTVAAEELITVSGSGSVSAVPEEAVVDIEVLSSSSRQQEAVERSAAATRRVLQTIRQSGISLTADEPYVYSVEPRSGRGGGDSDAVSYVVRRVITVVLRDPLKVKQVIDAAQRAGAGQASDVQHRSADISEARRLARGRALSAARDKAAAYAAARGGKIGDTVRVSEGGTQSFSRSASDFTMAGAQVDALAEQTSASDSQGWSGSLMITSSVWVTYELVGVDPRHIEGQRLDSGTISQIDER